MGAEQNWQQADSGMLSAVVHGWMMSQTEKAAAPK